MQTPQFLPTQLTPKADIPERGGWLTGLLALRGLWNMIAFFACMIGYDALGRPEVTVPNAGAMQKALLMTMAVCVVDLVGVTGAWMFKKWGVGLLVVMTAIDMFFSLQAGDVLRAVGRLVVLGAIAAAVWPRWRHYE